MPVNMPGLEALMKHQFGRQDTFAVANTAARAYPFGGRPDINLNWTDPEGDFGARSRIAPPYRGIPDLTANLTASSVYYNDLPLHLGGVLGGDVTPTGGGASKTWVYTPAILTPEDIDLYSYQIGNDVADLWALLYDGLIESVTFTLPRGLGAVSSSMNWRFGSVRHNTASEAALQSPFTIPTAGLTVSTTDIPVYAGHGELFIDDTAGAIGGTQISDALYGGQITITQAVDTKRFVNGTGFDVAGYSSGALHVEMQLDFAPTDDVVGPGSEMDAWFSETAVNRFVRLQFTSTAEASAGVPYSWRIDLPLRYYTQAYDAEGGNTVIQLTGNEFYDTTLTHAISSTVVNTLTTAGFETAVS